MHTVNQFSFTAIKVKILDFIAILITILLKVLKDYNRVQI